MNHDTNMAKAALILATALIVGCQQPKQKTYDDDDRGSRGTIVQGGGRPTSGGPGELITIPVQLIDATHGAGFHLADATAFTISLEGCATGYTSTADESSTALQVYKFDRGCKAKLTQFEFNGLTFFPTVGDPFTTWDAGDTATFDEFGEPGVNAVTVSVVSQLQDPVAGTEAIVYRFSEISQGADETILEAELGEGHTLTVGSQDPPSFTIHSVSFVGVNANGGGQFEFILECTSSIGATNVCEGVDMATMKYRLVEDTYGSTLTVQDADALFSGGQGTAITLPGDREAPGGTTTNGGFHTVTLDGPDQMALKPNMIFIIQADGASYQYFNVDVSTLTQD